ncbi:hypothetical protein [Spongiactinospora rosea]|uniref:hypothetical protein n=1 Tax=Spongiactinospora rosea TaxID=2248750 RepID=UPI0011C02E6B|nr:hypothetical protein [Spongiactinospora rosea]
MTIILSLATALMAVITPSSSAAEPKRLANAIRPNAALAETAQAALRAEQNSTPLVAGTLRDIRGNTLSGTPLRIDLEPTRSIIAASSSGVGIEYIKIGETRTADDGSFSFKSPELKDLAGYVDQEGVASALITSSGGSYSVWRRVYLHTPTGAKGEWTLAQPPAPKGPRPADPVSYNVDRSGFKPGVSREDESSLSLVGHANGAPANGSRQQGIPDPGQYCGTGEIYYFAMAEIPVQVRMVTLRGHLTGPDTTAKYEWTTTGKTEVEAAANVGAGGNLATVGFTNVQSVSAGITFEIGNFRPAHFRAQFQFRTWDLWCEDVITLKKRISGKYEWRPYKFTGGNEIATAGGPPNCREDHTTPIVSTTWVSRDTSWTYYGGVQLGDVKLDSRQTNGEYWKLSVIPDEPAEICGIDDYPVDASYVMEKF